MKTRTSARGKFSPRQLQIICLIGRGASYKRVASELGIAISTVRTHMDLILEKIPTEGYRPREAVARYYHLHIARPKLPRN